LPASYPASTLPLKVSPAGVLSTGQIQTVEIGDNQVTNTKMATDSVDTINIKDGVVTRPKLGPVGQQISAGVVSYSNSTSVFVAVSGTAITITTTGKPVVLGLKPKPTVLSGSIYIDDPVDISFYENGFAICTYRVGVTEDTFTRQYIPTSSLGFIREVGAGTYTYELYARCVASSGASITISNIQLFAYELF